MYCSKADIISRRLTETLLIQLTDDQEYGVADDKVVNDAISEAGEIIDGYLRKRYPLPLSTVPGLLRNLAVDLAVYALYGRGRCGTPERVTTDRDNAVKLLGKIQSGDVVLGVSDPATKAATEGPEAMQVATPGRTFGPDTLEQY
jgi:phage gp36-like protein